MVNQREVGQDSYSFVESLRHILREDPDVVLIGEIRDMETMEAALTIAETGHLTFGTLHTNSAVQTISRIIDIFPSDQQSQVRSSLSLSLVGVMSQTLIPKIDNLGRIMAAEVMIPNAAIRNLIRENKIHQIYSQLQLGQEKYGMQTLNQALASLVNNRIISETEAYSRSSDVDELRQNINSGLISKGGSLNNNISSNTNNNAGTKGTQQQNQNGSSFNKTNDGLFSGIDFDKL